MNLSVDRWKDAVNADSWLYLCTRGKIVKIRFERGLQPASPRFPEIWMLIAGFTLWYIWKARCLKVFQGTVRPPEEVIMDIWFTLISCLRGQLDEVFQPLQRRGHCPFALLAEMAEHAHGDARWK